jgi:hypothetical protein
MKPEQIALTLILASFAKKMHILNFFRIFFPAATPPPAEPAPKPLRKPRAKKKPVTAPAKKAPVRKKK